jgi:hypothetical protein
VALGVPRLGEVLQELPGDVFDQIDRNHRLEYNGTTRTVAIARKFRTLVPKELTVTRLGINEYVLSWDSVPGAVRYEVLWAEGTVYQTTEDTEVTVVLEAGSTLHLRVVAINARGHRSKATKSVEFVGVENES